MHYIRTTRIALVLAMVLAVGAVAATTPRPARAQVQANMENVRLLDFIKFVSQFSSRNIIYREDEIPNRTVTIFSQRPINEPELMAIFENVLKSFAMTAVAKGDILYIVPMNRIKGLVEQVTEKPLEGDNENLVITILPVNEKLPPAKMADFMKRVSSQFGYVEAIPQANAILIKDRRERIKEMVKLMDSIMGVQPGYRTEIYQLDNAGVAVVIKKIQTLFSELMKRGRLGEEPIFLPIEWSNSVLVSGTEDQLKTVAGLIKQLDQVDQKSSNMKIYRMHNTMAGNAASVLSTLLTREVQEKQKAQMDVTGAFSVSADPSTNSLIVMASPDLIKQVDIVVEQLDTPQDQVFVEALIMETSLENSEKFGVEWFLGGGSANSNLGTVGFMTQNSPLINYAQPMIEDGGAPNIAALTGGFNLGILGNMISFNGHSYPTIGAMVNFIKSNADFNLLSVPQIMTMDNKAAEIFVGENRPYKTGDKSSDTGTEIIAQYDYRDIGVTLKVTPHINRRTGLIRMDIDQQYSQFKGSATPENSAQDLPITLDRKTRTTVQMLDGSIIVISGIIETVENRDNRRVPLLSRLPVLGWLFKNDATSASKKTLMVFVSARIIKTMDQIEALSRTKMERFKRSRSRYRKYMKEEMESASDYKKSQQGKARPDGYVPTKAQEESDGTY